MSEDKSFWVTLSQGIDVLIEPDKYPANKMYPAYEVAEILRRYARTVRNGPGTRVKHTSHVLESIAADFEEGRILS